MTKPHAPHPFEVVAGRLLVGGRDANQLATLLGQTPGYVYDSRLVRDRVQALRSALPGGIELHYAMKANPMPQIVNLLADLVDGLDVASGRELQVALASGTRPQDISFAGPGKRKEEIAQAVAAGITLNIESPGELGRVQAAAESLGVVADIAIRVNPDFELKTSGMKMSGGPKPFGIDAETVPALYRHLNRHVRMRGFHIFSGSQNLRPEALQEAQRKTFELAWRLAEGAPDSIDMLNIGGGFGIPYFPGEQELDLSPIMAQLEVLLDEHHRRLPQAQVVVELGRYLVGPAGLYLCRVVDRKESRGQVFLVTDGGLHHHLAASGNFGQIIRKNYPLVAPMHMDITITEQVSVVGPLCTPLDLLGDRMELPQLTEGDLVAVLQSGAYGPTASPSRFLSHPEAGEILL